jgi:hypothetical protein
MKRFIIPFIAAYIFLFVWGWLFNGVVLKDVYAETPNLWRSQSEMMSLFHWIIIGQALVVFSFVMIYASGFAGGGVIAGIRLGVLLEITDRNAPRFLRSATDSRKVDPLRKCRRFNRNDHRRRNGWRDLQTRVQAKFFAVS